MEYAGKVTHRVMNRIMLSLHAYLAGGKLYGYSLRKANFPLQQRNKFYLTIMVVVKH